MKYVYANNIEINIKLLLRVLAVLFLLILTSKDDVIATILQNINMVSSVRTPKLRYILSVISKQGSVKILELDTNIIFCRIFIIMYVEILSVKNNKYLFFFSLICLSELLISFKLFNIIIINNRHIR